MLVAFIAPINQIYLPSIYFIPGNAAQTAANIATDTLTYRLGLCAGLASCILFLLVVMNLYSLLKDVDRHQARVMVILVTIGVGVSMLTLIFQFAPLILLSGADYLSPFSKPQLDALASVFFRLRNGGNYFAIAFWALWLYPFGRLVMKSGFMPKILGVLLIIGCFGYLAVSLTGLVFPTYLQPVNQIAMPFYAVGEVSTILWLLIRGGRIPSD